MLQPMKRILPLLAVLCFSSVAHGQWITGRLTKAWLQFMQDPQLKAAMASLYVVDAKTGKVVFDRNGGTGLAPASTQKIITAASAYALLGKEFRYETELRHDGTIRDSILSGNLYIIGSGDPTLGSWRWKETADTLVIGKWISALKQKGIGGLHEKGLLIADESSFETQPIPDGWIWQDIGNYYGAGSWGLNWKENQFELVLRSGPRMGDSAAVVRSGLTGLKSPVSIRNELKAAAKGSGDNAYIYMPIFTHGLHLLGTIPVNENSFSISGSMPFPPESLLQQLSSKMKPLAPLRMERTSSLGGARYKAGTGSTRITAQVSPSLDSIIFWFQRRSINLYGEALLKSISLKAFGSGVTDTGVQVVKRYWKEAGIDPVEINVVDGSGLSPLNRVTTRAQVAVLQHARAQHWFSGYHHSFPEFNGMKMKSGTIRGVKGFAGYHTSREGSEYIFSFIVNNYNGSSASLVRKMYAVLDLLK